MGELIIENPVNNGNFYRRYAFESLHFRPNFYRFLDLKEITPKTHPKVVDLCAGDGSISKLLTDKGWNPRDLTCVDLYKSPTPLVNGVTWRYWDLEELADHLKILRDIPAQILDLQNTFDFVVLWNGFLRRETETSVCKFFVRLDGETFMDAICS